MKRDADVRTRLEEEERETERRRAMTGAERELDNRRHGHGAGHCSILFVGEKSAILGYLGISLENNVF